MIDNSVRRNKQSDSCSTFVFIMFVVGTFLLLFSYTDSLINSNNTHSVYKIPFYSDEFAVQRYTYTCQNNKCVRILLANEEQVSLNTCHMLCTEPQIWPKPVDFRIKNKQASVINKRNMIFVYSKENLTGKMLQNATDLFIENLDSLKPENESSSGMILTVNIILSDSNITKIRLDTSESYQLTITKKVGLNVTIEAQNYFGARHGLETLSQIIWYDDAIEELRILHDVVINDFPKFSYRGLMIDTARNYFPMSLLKKVVDGMAMTKLNVLHLHITDAESFPLVLPKVPELASFGAYGPNMIYTPGDIRDLLQYALIRGIRILLEVDAPSHVNAGWNFNPSEKYVICGENEVENGHLNPDNENTLQVLENIYSDLLELNDDDDLFHIGADEVNLNCWKNTETVKKMGLQNSMKTFWAFYTNKILERLKSANNNTFPKNVIMWSSPLTESPSDFSKVNLNVTVQLWLGNPRSILQQGHSIIYSTVDAWYLDCGFGPWRSSKTEGNCDPYRPWSKFYNYRPWVKFGHEELVLGGEVCLWAEQVGIESLETRIWPRSAAFAERVWSDPPVFDSSGVSARLVSFVERLEARGLKSAAIWPRWCSQNPGRC